MIYNKKVQQDLKTSTSAYVNHLLGLGTVLGKVLRTAARQQLLSYKYI